MPRGADWNGLTLLELRSVSKPALPESCTFLANYFTPSDRPPLIQAVFEIPTYKLRKHGPPQDEARGVVARPPSRISSFSKRTSCRLTHPVLIGPIVLCGVPG